MFDYLHKRTCLSFFLDQCSTFIETYNNVTPTKTIQTKLLLNLQYLLDIITKFQILRKFSFIICANHWESHCEMILLNQNHEGSLEEYFFQCNNTQRKRHTVVRRRMKKYWNSNISPCKKKKHNLQKYPLK